MEVRLMAVTPRAEEVCAAAFRSCHDHRDAYGIPQTDEIITTRIRNAIKVGHTSTLEHAVFTFSVKGVSRALTHQLVRHRIASYSQQSQRFVRLTNQDYVTPESIMKNDNYRAIYSIHMKGVWELYNMMINDFGIPPEDARFILPNACTTNIVVTMNARELRHFLKLRLAKGAQWEIRELAARMLELAWRECPHIFEDFGDYDE